MHDEYKMLGHIFMEPYLDRHCKQYKNILTLNEIPAGPLAERVKRINMPNLSEFRDYTNTCKYVIMDEHNKHMEMERLPMLMSFLVSNGYTIDYQMSKLLKQHTPGKMICSFIY